MIEGGYMFYVYVLITSFLYPLTLFLPFINKKAKKFVDSRNIDKKKILNFIFHSKKKKVYWLHASSVGELEQSKSIANEILAQEPQSLIIQSTFSESVTEKNFVDSPAIIHFKLPLDFYFSYDFIFKKFSPKFLILLAWDTWPNLILAAKRHKCKVLLACATINSKSGRKNFLVKKLSKEVFQNLDGISPNHEIFLNEFWELTEEKVPIKVCGDSRFDSVVQKINNQQVDSKFKNFAKSFPYQKIIVLGSTYSQCEEVLLPILSEIIEKNDCGIWIFPHQIHLERIREIKQRLESLNLPYSIYSKSNQEQREPIVIVDELGLLAFSYKYSTVTYIGGAIHNRVHNVIEPAYFGNPIVTGKLIFNSAEAILLNELGGLFQIKDSNTAKVIFQELLNNNNVLKQIKTLNKEFVKQNLFASKRFYEEFLKK